MNQKTSRFGNHSTKENLDSTIMQILSPTSSSYSKQKVKPQVKNKGRSGSSALINL